MPFTMLSLYCKNSDQAVLWNLYLVGRKMEILSLVYVFFCPQVLLLDAFPFGFWFWSSFNSPLSVQTWYILLPLMCFLSKMLEFHQSPFFFSSNCFLQIEKAEFSCPSWFPVAAKSLIHRILDPNPETVSISSMTRHWFLYVTFVHSLGCIW